MKIAIITKHYVKNYGSVLQTYATQELLKNGENEVFVINYALEQAVGKNFMNIILRKHTNPFKRSVYKMMLLPSILRMEKIFGDFLRNNIQLSGEQITDYDELKKNLPRADIYCTGSDQVWNPKSNQGLLPVYFYDFLPEGKRVVSFAASFGVDKIADEEKIELQKYLKKYSLISVRESSGKTLVEQAGYNCQVVLDPVLSVKKEIWKRFIQKRIIKEKYVLIYQLNSNSIFDQYAGKVAKYMNKKLVRICTRYDQMIKNGKHIFIPTVEEWINLFYYADFVITDSFHGTAFSILFEKEFVDICPPLYSERLEHILKMFGLEERKITKYEDINIVDRKIDYPRVNGILQAEREKTQQFIEKILDEK